MSFKNKQEIADERELLPTPGDTLLETIEARNMTQAELAERMGRPKKTINEIINAKASITAETACQLERVLSVPADFWLEKERRYQLKLVELAEAEKLLEEAEFISHFPLAKMKKLGWIGDFANNAVSKAQATYRFFGVSGKQQYEKLYHSPVAGCHFRLGRKGEEQKPLDAFAVTAWLRQGERLAADLTAPLYNEAAFRETLAEAKKLMVAKPTGFFEDLQAICLRAGVKLVHVPCIPGTPMHGCIRWMDGNPVIQLSCNFQRLDIFWFNFFHEAAHVLLHSRKDVFIEGLQYDEEQQKKEDEANEFAACFLLSKEQEAAFLAHAPYDRNGILAAAKRYQTLPGVLWGHFARNDRSLNAFGWKWNLFQKLEL